MSEPTLEDILRMVEEGGFDDEAAAIVKETLKREREKDEYLESQLRELMFDG